MAARLLILLCVLVSTLDTLSQTADYSRWLNTVDVKGKPIPMLRVPQNEADPKTQSYIYNIQWQLDRNRQFFQEGRKVEFGLRGQVEMSCRYIQKLDSLFPVHYYREEASAYLVADEQNERSHAAANLARIKQQEDSIRLINMKEGYNWINADTVWVRIKPDTKSGTIGRLYRLGYVRPTEVPGMPEWVAIRFADHQGYVMLRELADNWEEMKLAEEELDELKSGRYFSFDPSPAYKAKMDREAAENKRDIEVSNAAARKKYIRGPKGGCYFINPNGNRQYVERSNCN